MRSSNSSRVSTFVLFYFHKTFRLVQGRTQPHIQYVSGVFTYLKSGCSIRHLATHLPPPGVKIKCIKVVPPRACHRHKHKKTSPLSLLAMCKIIQCTLYSSLCDGQTKDQGSFRDPTQCNFDRQKKDVVVKLEDARAITKCFVPTCILFSSH
jgi:hypothetical protein